MNSAAASWKAAANVNFTHRSTLDRDACSQRAGVVFVIRPGVSSGELIGTFSPASPRRQRVLRVDPAAFGNIKSWSLTGLFRHALGHVLGFRHEHTRPEAAACFEDDNWRALTEYDPSSVMHLPQCNGTNDGDFVLTALDEAGARILYP